MFVKFTRNTRISQFRTLRAALSYRRGFVDNRNLVVVKLNKKELAAMQALTGLDGAYGVCSIPTSIRYGLCIATASSFSDL